MKKINSQWSMVNSRWLISRAQWIIIVLVLALSSCSMPKERIELRQIKDVIADASAEPTLKAKAIFYNPNNTRARLKKIDVEIFVNGKKVGKVDQDLKLIIPAKDEFFVNLEVKLALKELGFMDTLFGMLGGKKFQIEYKGFLKLTYHGFPIRVPVNYKDEIKVKF